MPPIQRMKNKIYERLEMLKNQLGSLTIQRNQAYSDDIHQEMSYLMQEISLLINYVAFERSQNRERVALAPRVLFSPIVRRRERVHLRYEDDDMDETIVPETPESQQGDPEVTYIKTIRPNHHPGAPSRVSSEV